MAKVKEERPGTGYYKFFCPGCKREHIFWTNRDRGQSFCWHFNNDLEKPTVRASILNDPVEAIGYKRCHLFITDGKIQYLGDCGHELAGKTVDMVDVE